MIFQNFSTNVAYGSTLVLLGIISLVYSEIRFHQYLRSIKEEDYRQENNMDFIGYVPIAASYDPDRLIKKSVWGLICLLGGGLYLTYVLGICS